MSRFSAVTAVVVALLALPALASAAPTASQITAPQSTAYVTGDAGNPGSLHVAGTTLGGTGDIDLRCYYGSIAPLVASGVHVNAGSFSVDVPVTAALAKSLGTRAPFCMLRAVPTGTVPSAPIDMPSPWEGVLVGWGVKSLDRVGGGFAPTSPDALTDYYVARAQSGAYNDFYSAGACGLCDTFLVDPASGAFAHPIWWGNASLSTEMNGAGRASVEVDGVPTYAAYGAAANEFGLNLADNPGFPSLAERDGVAWNGDLDIQETGSFARCAEAPSAFPPTDASCASFTDSGVHYERDINQTDSGQLVTIVDHWQSVDGKPHDIDALYYDSEYSVNAGIAGREGRANFTWTQDGFKAYPKNTPIPVFASAPATMLLKTDASTPAWGDSLNPFGAMTFGSKPAEIRLVQMDNSSGVGEWASRYTRTIPAGGEITIAFAYSDDLTLPGVQGRVPFAAKAVTPPAIHIDTPADGATVDASSVHVSGTASSADGEVEVKVNGVHAPVDASGNWSADVPLNDAGATRVAATAYNDIGVATNAAMTVNRPLPPAPSGSGAGSGTTPATTPATPATPVHCVVPKLRGKTLIKAKILLKRAHCRLGKLTTARTSRIKPGRVVRAGYRAGTRHAAGARIRLTIAQARAR